MEVNSQVHVKEVIDVESHKSKPCKEPKIWILELGPRQADRKILLSHTAWLTDNITNAAQKLLKKANPADVTCGLTMNFDEEHIESSYRFHTQGMDTGSLYRLLG